MMNSQDCLELFSIIHIWWQGSWAFFTSSKDQEGIRCLRMGCSEFMRKAWWYVVPTRVSKSYHPQTCAFLGTGCQGSLPGWLRANSCVSAYAAVFMQVSSSMLYLHKETYTPCLNLLVYFCQPLSHSSWPWVF